MQLPAGTGKTAAYCIGVLNQIDVSDPFTQAIVMTDTCWVAQLIRSTIKDTLGQYTKVDD